MLDISRPERPSAVLSMKPKRGMEIHVGYSDDDTLRTERVADIHAGHRLAVEWRGCIEKGLAELAAPETPQ
jgi:hypothetical protein